MFKKILLISFLALPVISTADVIRVSPASLQTLPSQELGQVVLKFIPSVGETVDWSKNANDLSFKWLDSKYVEATRYDDGTIYSTRRAIYRGNVNGVKSTFLDKRVYEMPWLVTLRGEAQGKFGVDSVEFYPYVLAKNSNDSSTCFGSTHENCDFTPFNSLKKAGITYKKICENQMGAGNFNIVYLLSKKGKKNTYGIWSQSDGSGGSSNSFELDFSSSNAEVCKKVRS